MMIYWVHISTATAAQQTLDGVVYCLCVMRVSQFMHDAVILLITDHHQQHIQAQYQRQTMTTQQQSVAQTQKK